MADRLDRLNQRRDAAGSRPTAPADAGPRQSPQLKRRHAAGAARLGALAMSCASAGGLTYLFAGINSTQASTASLASLPAPVAAATSTTSTASTASTTAPTTAVAATSAMTAYDGEIVDTRYGPVQIQVQVTDGAISDVAVIEYPDGDGKSVRINARALPTLRSEVLTAQSAAVDTVSGATYTSDAYTQSLQSAIDQARAAGATALA
jgi:uncharacterized protein with FMN-binding domain